MNKQWWLRVLKIQDWQHSLEQILNSIHKHMYLIILSEQSSDTI